MNGRFSMLSRPVWVGLALGLLAASAQAEVSVTRGTTPIPDGEATAAEDITVANDHLAFSIAVASQPPWGVPRGTLVDLAAVKGGKIDLDRIAFADFIPNNWSAWPNDGKTIRVVERSPERAVIEIARNFGEAMVTTTYTLEAGSDRVHLETTLDNRGDTPMKALRSGFTLWPDTGYRFGVPGLGDAKETPADDALTDRFVGYDRDWAIALHAPYFDRINYGGRDLYLEHSLAPGESRTFEGWLQVVPEGDLAPVVANEIARKGLASGHVEGTLEGRDGGVPSSGLVMVEKAGSPYAWTLADDKGHFAIDLPVGDYALYATGEGYANSDRVEVSLAKGAQRSLTFDDLAGPGTLSLDVAETGSGTPRDARITIEEGHQPPVEFLGKQTFFTRLDPVGHAELSLAPGDYRLAVNAGAGFTARSKPLAVSLDAGQTLERNVGIERLAEPNQRHWYGADLHHHANMLEGVTPPEMVVRAQLATDLDLTFVSDHDSTANLDTMATLSKQRGVPFIPSIEISPSWGHMNPFPIALDSQLQVDPGTADVQTIIADARRMGAEVVPTNHPYNGYGYLGNLAEDKVPGGFTPAFDLVELNAEVDNARTLESVHRFWDQGLQMYLTAGTDTHDVWNQLTGRMRMMAHVPGELSVDGFARALKDGHAYATQGPLLFPVERLFGDTLRLAGDAEGHWSVKVQAVDGLAEARLIGRGGKVLETRQLDGHETTLDFTIPGDADGWVALEVDDADGDTAWSDPLWIRRPVKADYVLDETESES